MNGFNFNIDYYGLCHGNCVGCLLTEQERNSDQLFQTNNNIVKVFAELLHKNDRKDDVVVAFGRGNLLLLGDDEIEALSDTMNRMVGIMDDFHVNSQVFELSTSLIGPYDKQLLNARKLASQDKSTFVIVADGALMNKNNYWTNIRRFLDDMSEYRGGHDGSGDVLGLNITLKQLPDVAYLEKYLAGIHSPINVIWSPTLDAEFINDESMRGLADWLVEMSEAGFRHDWDLNINNIGLLSIEEMNRFDDAKSIIHASRQRNFILDKEGELSEGLFCLYGDIDPMRSAVVISQHDPRREQVESDAMNKLRMMLKRRSCLTCPMQRACVASGAYQYVGFVSAHLEDKKTCPTGLRKVLENSSR